MKQLAVRPAASRSATILRPSSARTACEVIALSLGVKSAGPDIVRRFAELGGRAAQAAGSTPAAVAISLISDVLTAIIPFQAIASNATHTGAVRAQDVDVRYAELLLLKPMSEKVREFERLPPLGSLRTAPSASYPFGHTVFQGPEILVGHFFREQVLEAGVPESDNPDYELQIAAFMAASDDDSRKLRETFFNPSLFQYGGVRARVYQRYMDNTCGQIRDMCRSRGVTLRKVLA